MYTVHIVCIVYVVYMVYIVWMSSAHGFLPAGSAGTLSPQAPAAGGPGIGTIISIITTSIYD